MGEDAGGLHHAVDVDVLVGDVAAVLLAREHHAEGHGVGHHAGVGAAADGQGLRVVAGQLVVHLHQAAHDLVIGGDVVRGVAADAAHVHAILGHRAGDVAQNLHFVGAQRVADVQRGAEVFAVPAQNAQVAAQVVGDFVLALDVQGCAVGLHADALGHHVECRLHARARADGLQRDQQHARRVHAQLRQRTMREHALGADLRATVAQILDGQLLIDRCRVGRDPLFDFGAGKLLRADDGVGVGGNNVGALTRVELVHGNLGLIFAFAAIAQLHVHAALFDVDHRELRVRGEAVVGHLQLRGVVAHVAHAHLLVAAQDQPHAVLQRHARVAHRAHGVQRAQRRALVVDGAAAKDLAVGDLAAEGIVGPALAGGNHVQVGQHAQGLLTAAHGDVAGVVVDVAGLKAVVPGGGKRRFQHLRHHRAEGLVAVAAGRYRGNGDPFLNVADQLVLQLHHPRVNLCIIDEHWS